MENERNDRLDRLETGLRKTQDSILLMSKDIHSMNDSIRSIANSMETLVEVQQNMKVMEERCETRNTQLKEADKVIHARLDTLFKKDDSIAKKADNGDRAYSILVSIAKWLGAGTVALFISLMVFLVELKGQ